MGKYIMKKHCYNVKRSFTTKDKYMESVNMFAIIFCPFVADGKSLND